MPEAAMLPRAMKAIWDFLRVMRVPFRVVCLLIIALVNYAKNS
nr:MAG TPA: hypothetical protein [Caudoviricetes sp.]